MPRNYTPRARLRKNCGTCGVEFVTNGNGRYCGDRCQPAKIRLRTAAKAKTAARPCERCHAVMGAAHGRQRFCAKCRRAAFNLRATLYGYGLTIADFDAMMAKQGGVCAICGDPPATTTRLVVDHCHATGKVRGLLCYACNCGIGFLKDSPTRTLAALLYLRNHAQLRAAL